ncbi:GNAT family N-acetyltransferase [Paludibacterium paludis]|uniref:N-acetyltransferase domain-containing protein n=1 Tax=Paludibacterium paludis TaxID=1225769 RepID=A0A918UAR3_9NEIS|nr:GNAT family protein [Paludibacterium paludis]GGY20191.1 hypothetical protein GCM10011289_24650 [Paludibacterium paludis]
MELNEWEASVIVDLPPELNLNGFYLRQLALEDVADWYAYLRMPEVNEFTSWNLQSEKDLEPFVDSAKLFTPTSPIRLAIVDRKIGRLVGVIGFHTISDVNRSAEITYDLAPQYWGRGIGTEVCRTVTAWAHRTRGFLRIQGTTLETNARSESVLQRCGYQYEGLLRAYRMVRGVPGNFKMFSHLASDPD